MSFALPSGVVEGYIHQHPVMSALSKRSVNTIRVVTIFAQDQSLGIETGKVHFLYAGFRIGAGDSFVDNLHSGGMMANVDIETGRVITKAVDHANRAYEIHPDTHAVILGFQIPYFEEVKNLIREAGHNLPGYFGWDIAITENGPVIVEANTKPGADGLQTPYVPQKKGMRHVIEKYL